MKTREAIWTALKADVACDVLILGGGVNGAGLLRELALQGVRCLLVDKYDYAAGASSKSSRMIHGGLRKEDDAPAIPDPSRGMTLVMLSIATSIDALAVGLSLALLDVNVFWSAVVIGGVSAALSFIGLMLGNRLGLRFGKTMEVIGGIILIGIGLRVLITHLSA